MVHRSVSFPGMQGVIASAVCAYDSGHVISQCSGVGALARQIVLNKRLHDSVHTGIGLEAELQGPLRGEGTGPTADDPLDSNIRLPTDVLQSLCSGSALQCCQHVADLYGESRHNEGTSVLERRCREVMDPHQRLHSLA